MEMVYNIAGPVLGPTFTKDNFPLTGEFIAKVVKDAGFGVNVGWAGCATLPVTRRFCRHPPHFDPCAVR